MTRTGFETAVSNFKRYGFDVLVIMGGNGSFIGTGSFKTVGVNTVFIPATIDNDVPGYKKSLGFSSACENAVKMVDMLRATMETSERDHIIQLMGRHCSELTRRVGVATFADVIDYEGSRMTPEHVAAVFRANRQAGKDSSFMVMQELKGEDAVQEKMSNANYLDRVSKAYGDSSIRMSVLGYLQRGAEPSCFDRYLGVRYGKAAVECIVRKQFGMGLDLRGDVISLQGIELSPIPN